MAKKNSNKKQIKRSPLLYLLLILIPVVLFFVIAIPIKYASTYKELRVYVFKDKAYNATTSEPDENGNTKTTYSKKENIIWGDLDTIEDFDLYVYCTDYNMSNSETNTLTFGAFGVKNENTTDKKFTSFTIVLGMYNTWLSLSKESSTRTITLVDKPIDAIKNGTSVSSSKNPSITVSGIPQLPAKGTHNLPFTKVKKIPLYAFVSYSYTTSGTKFSKEFVIEIDYKDYIIDEKITLGEGADQTFIPITFQS